MNSILKVIIATLWDALIPRVIRFLDTYIKKKKIEEAVDEEVEEMEQLRDEAKKFFEENPDAENIPEELESRFRDAAIRRSDGLLK